MIGWIGEIELAVFAGVDVDQKADFWKNPGSLLGGIDHLSKVGSKANPVSNVLLTAFALFLGGLPDSTEAIAEPGDSVAYVFREPSESPLLPVLERPQWMTESRDKHPTIRGQSPNGYYPAPQMNSPYAAGYPGASPYASQSDPALPFMNDPGPVVISGINGPQMHRMGFTPIFDAAYIAPSSAHSPGSGRMSVQEYDGALRHTSMLGDGWVFTNTAQGGTRLWDGPDKPNLPGSVFRIGWDFMLNTPTVGPWSAQFDFNPSIDSDFQSSLGREGVNLDGNATAFYRVSPQFMWVLGVQYWDRVDKMILPNAGLVWNPNDRLEVRLLFPKSRIAYFLGNFGEAAHWLYATAEYHVESYQIQQPGVSDHNQVQLSDWRASLGLRSDHGWYDKFLEVGFVFGRNVEFKQTTPDFNLDNGFMARLGVRF